MILIRSILFYILFYIGTGILLLVLLPTLLLTRPLFVPRIFTGYARWLLCHVVGLNVRITGLENIPNDKGFLIVANHQSAWETLVFFTIFKDPVMILKKELTYIPMFGWFLKRTGMIPLDRSAASRSFKELLQHVHDRIHLEHRPVCVFPEGTRCEPGKPGDFKRGVYLMHAHAKTDILCVAHNAGMYWSPHKFLIQPGTVNMFIYPILPSSIDVDTLKTMLPGMIKAKAIELTTAGDKK